MCLLCFKEIKRERQTPGVRERERQNTVLPELTTDKVLFIFCILKCAQSVLDRARISTSGALPCARFTGYLFDTVPCGLQRVYCGSQK